MPRGELLKVSAALVRKARERSRLKKIPISIDATDVLGLIQQQKFRCAVSGVPFSFENINESRRKPFAPSIDRIVREDGYVIGNIRITSVITNLAIGDFSEADFLAMCCGVTSSAKFK
jgi:hypothetical protein